MFRAKPLPGDLTPPVDADDDYDDDYDAELDQSPLDLAAMVTEALGRGLGNTETMLEQAAKRHGVASVGGRRGPKQVAKHLLLGEQQMAYDTGDVERLAWLRSPEGAKAAIDEAGRQGSSMRVRPSGSRSRAINRSAPTPFRDGPPRFPDYAGTLLPMGGAKLVRLV